MSSFQEGNKSVVYFGPLFYKCGQYVLTSSFIMFYNALWI